MRAAMTRIQKTFVSLCDLSYDFLNDPVSGFDYPSIDSSKDWIMKSFSWHDINCHEQIVQSKTCWQHNHLHNDSISFESFMFTDYVFSKTTRPWRSINSDFKSQTDCHTCLCQFINQMTKFSRWTQMNVIQKDVICNYIILKDLYVYHESLLDINSRVIMMSDRL